MQNVFKFLRDNWKFAVIIATVVGGLIKIDFTLKQGPPDSKPEVIIIIPADGGNDPAFLGAARDRPHPILMAYCRVKAGQLYQKERPDLSLRECIQLARVVPEAEIVAEALAKGITFSGPMISGGPLQNLLDWIAANPEKVEAIIKLIVLLIPLFA